MKKSIFNGSPLFIALIMSCSGALAIPESNRRSAINDHSISHQSFYIAKSF